MSLALTQSEREEVTRLREQVAHLEAQCRTLGRKVDGYGRTLYGTEGNGGLNNDVQGVINTLASHMEREGSAIDRQGVILVGVNGDKGVLSDVRDMQGSMKRAEETRKLVWGVIGALGLAAFSAVLAWILSKF